jgi:hypothetical protein
MCGRYTDTRRKKAMLASVGLQADLAFVPRYNIAPTQEASIVADGRLEHKAGTLVPAGVGEGSTIRASHINARAERGQVAFPRVRNGRHKVCFQTRVRKDAKGPNASCQQDCQSALFKKMASGFVLLASLLAVGVFLLSCALNSAWTVEFHPHVRFYRHQRMQTVGQAYQRQVRRVTEVHFGPFALSAIDQQRTVQR